MTTWIEVLIAMVDGPQHPVSGVVKPYRNTDEPLHLYYGSYGEEPILLVLPPCGIRLSRWGNRFRIESLDGALMLCADGTTVWDFRDNPDRPRQTKQERMYFFGPGRALVLGRPAEHWVGERAPKPIGLVSDIEFLGRRCWSVTLAACTDRRRRRQVDQEIIVDAETGAVVAQHSTDGIEAASYIDLDVTDTLDPDLFRWDGPVVTDEDSRQLAGRPSPNRQQLGAEWFRENVTADPIEVPVLVDLSPRMVDVHNADTGEFTVYLGDMTHQGLPAWITRRVRSEKPWKVGLPQFQIFWSTSKFDWTAVVSTGRIDEDAVRQLQQWLHPHEAVAGTPPIAPHEDSEP
ncbi:hypothetical protein [Rhodococcus sp. OK302]|uniref:hypothetical protein n=1 Tax=Rhodococcus sp. OK302 TaxID=1882769 RepID=UPI000B9406B0|nr:hypothetical protein [Rhodococcus sp. OK302]OYD69910.1 hypothetical protein BDB13_3494 [Rhodococcus sp. OK302]